MALSSNLGFPRIGSRRQLKWALERYWAGRADIDHLVKVGQEIRRENWQLQSEAGIDQIPSNDFSFYDHVLDTIAMVGGVPPRFGWSGERVDMDTYFAMARGTPSAAALELTKWFDTNYHYMVPEFQADQQFHLAFTKPIDEFKEALQLGLETRPVILGPLSFLVLGKVQDEGFDRLNLLDALIPVYREVLAQLAQAGAEWVQIDEPCLVLDLDEETRQAYGKAYRELTISQESPKILIATYFGALHANLSAVTALPVHGLHVDLVRGPQQLMEVVDRVPDDWVLSAGVVDGRNVWKNNIGETLQTLEEVEKRLGGNRLWISPSCSMIHVPVDLDAEERLDEEIKDWLAFAKQKLSEVVNLTKGFNEGRGAIQDALEINQRTVESRKQSGRVFLTQVQARMDGIEHMDLRNRVPFHTRKILQQEALKLPIFPTTTIGSFPQTPEIRKQRDALRKGERTLEQYDRFLEGEIEKIVRFQEEIGLDVLVHGEPERNDMVQYFGEQMTGIAFTQNGWVQSYGSRCVRPPIIYGDVSRPEPMTVRWITYAQSLTDKPVKGMVTGPITILQWSFVRDDQPRSQTARQIALAIRDEVKDLEEAGIRVIQIDEPAIREGLPLLQSDWNEYLDWAVECFHIVSSVAQDQTQIHTHMCYAEFQDIIEAIGKMDADVISIEASRSDMELLSTFTGYRYPNDLGPGIWDIHSPRVPSGEEIENLLRSALRVLDAEQLWVNPDCGLKTRKWEEVQASLIHMVEATRRVREHY